jgi:hypothetical protein
MMENKIYYRRTRPFGELFSATFSYIKQNFKSFFGSIILFSVPVIVLMTLLLVNIVSRATSGIGKFSGFEGVGFMFLMISVIAILSILMQTVFITVINQHLILNEKLENDGKVTVGDIGNSFFSSFWRVLGNMLLFGIIAVILLIIYAIFISLLTMAFVSMGAAGAIFSALLQLLFSLMVTPIISYYAISCLFVVQKDKVNVFTAISKVTHYLKGDFWTTWAVSFVGYIMTYIASVIVAIPIIIFFILGIFTRMNYNPESTSVSMATIILGAVVFVVTVVLFLCVYSVYLLLCTYQYTSLEEKNEGINIIDKINQIQ